jgi:alpha-tubulin suppressor-like RCC1 family protein
LKNDGTVWCWGDNFAGQLGDGTKTEKNKPVMVKGLKGVISIKTSGYHTVAMKSDGTVWCWGFNNYGQLGDGTKKDRTLPTQVKNLSSVRAIAASKSGTFALKDDGTLWGWGEFNNGQRFSGGTPLQLPGLKDAAAVSARGYGLMILKKDGTVLACGSNMSGNSTRGMAEAAPAPVPGISGVSQITSGWFYSLALKTNGEVWGWKDNCYGQLGLPDTDRLRPVKVKGF